MHFLSTLKSSVVDYKVAAGKYCLLDCSWLIIYLNLLKVFLSNIGGP